MINCLQLAAASLQARERGLAKFLAFLRCAQYSGGCSLAEALPLSSWLSLLASQWQSVTVTS